MDGLHVVDSSGWLEYLADGPNARHFSAPLADPSRLLVPTISLYEVFRVVLRERGDDAIRAAALMRQGREIALSPALALGAARLAHERSLAMADAIILATARASRATLWTQDADFDGVAGVRYYPRRTIRRARTGRLAEHRTTRPDKRRGGGNRNTLHGSSIQSGDERPVLHRALPARAWVWKQRQLRQTAEPGAPGGGGRTRS